MQRQFEGIWIPKEIWLDQTMGWSEKLLFVEIRSLANNGECFASNEYFAKFFGLSKDRISKMLTCLNRKGLIDIQLIYRAGTKQIEKRIITPIPIGESTYTPRRKHLDPLGEKADTPIGENAYDNNTKTFNNTDNNTINNNKKNKQKKSEIEMEFESLWKEYPRKLGAKKKARESYVKAVKLGSTTYEQVQYGIEMYKKYIDYHNIAEEFIKHGSTWFNQECWSNDYTCKPKVIQGKRHGFLGLVLNEMDYEKAQGNVIDHEESIDYGQETSGAVIGYATNSLPFSL
jgi:hypothetical protein